MRLITFVSAGSHTGIQGLPGAGFEQLVPFCQGNLFEPICCKYHVFLGFNCCFTHRLHKIVHMFNLHEDKRLKVVTFVTVSSRILRCWFRTKRYIICTTGACCRLLTTKAMISYLEEQKITWSSLTSNLRYVWKTSLFSFRKWSALFGWW